MKNALAIAAFISVLASLPDQSRASWYSEKLQDARTSLVRLLERCGGARIEGVEEVREGATRVLLSHDGIGSYECVAEAVEKELSRKEIISEDPCIISGGLCIRESVNDVPMSAIDLRCHILQA